MISSEGALAGAEAARRLAQLGRCQLAPGLTDAEFDRIEREYNIEFADDHRAFLATWVPINTPFEKEERVFSHLGTAVAGVEGRRFRTAAPQLASRRCPLRC